AIEPLLWFANRQVDRRERDIQEERLVAAILDPLHGIVREEIGDVPFFFEPLAVAVPGVGVRAFLVLVVIRTTTARERAIAVVEAEPIRAPVGIGAKVPLADESGLVAGPFQGTRQRD